jgi:hypothetical protein
MLLTQMRQQSISGQLRIVSQCSRNFRHSLPEEPDLTLAGSDRLVAGFAGHVAITATQAVVSPNRFVARRRFQDYSAAVFSDVCSKPPPGML